MVLSPLKQILLQGYKQHMIQFLQQNPDYIDEAFDLALGNDQPFSWRSAWLLTDCLEQNDVRITSKVNSLLAAFDDKTEGHQREYLKLLLLAELNDETNGIVFDKAVKIWSKLKNQPSLRFTALRTMIKIAEKYVELKQEIFFLLDEHYLKSLSPGIKNAALKLKKELK